MDVSLPNRLAETRAAMAELARVARRLTDARAERTRLAEHLSAMEVVLRSEQADVDRFRGVGGFFRKLVGGGGELSLEEHELVAAKLQHDALVHEQHATALDIAQLEQRHAKASAASAGYVALLAEAEAGLRGTSSPHGAVLARLAEADARVRIARRDVADAITAGLAAQDQFVAVQALAAEVRGLQRADSDHDVGFGALSVAGALREKLRSTLSAAQHALAVFQRECRDVAPVVEGIAVTPLPNLHVLVAQAFLFTTRHHVDNVSGELDLLSSYVVNTTLELRGRDQQLQQAGAGILAERAAILDPG